ncbi:MAG TPA: hypothetical protein VI997_09850 [Candidatus Thermoplasmatota archaeon]|nr:hypothetical protein [Candidatus Thermoplasmatota archaeon]
MVTADRPVDETDRVRLVVALSTLAIVGGLLFTSILTPPTTTPGLRGASLR